MLVSSLSFPTDRSTHAESNADHADYLIAPQEFETKTNFQETAETNRSTIPYGTDYVDDAGLELGIEKEIEEGKTGERTKTFKATYWQGQEIYRVLSSERVIEPKNQRVLRGTKIVWKDLPTPDQGILKFWNKLRVWATSYDGNCLGCTGRTYSGTPVQVGTCAVDPRVIVMGSHFFVPGYGLCSALDIGGAVKGNKIDLGFPDVRQGWWSARFVDIYLLDGEPKSL